MHTKTLQNDDLQRNKGLSIWSGKIIKGTLNQANTKLRVSSIPSKYQNIVYRGNSQPAFGDSTQKFYKPSQAEGSALPGPGFYNLNCNSSKIDSKKGSGFFASSTKLHRIQRSKSSVPGPGTYKDIDLKQKKIKNKRQSNKKSQSFLNSSQSTASMSSKIQAHELFKNQIWSSKDKPGVGQYNLNPQKILKMKNSLSTFKSKLQRFTIQSERAPPVGLYQLSQETDYNIPKRTKKYDNNSNRQQSQYERQKKIQNAIRNLQKKEQKDNIGPGSYNPSLNSTLKNVKIKDNMYDRFGELKPIYVMAKTIDVQNQNMFAEQQKAQYSPNKNNITSIFKSTTKKWDIRLSNQMDPGIYSPNKYLNKKSHLINFTQKWI